MQWENQRRRNGMLMNREKVSNRWLYPRQMAQQLNELDDEEQRLESERNEIEGFHPVCIPGFRRRKPVTELKGSCMLCHSTSVLTLLLKSPSKVATQNFPREGSYAKIAFPLAMGNFAEVDLLSFFVCCDACALYVQRAGICTYSDTIVGALCLVCVKDNQAAWLEGFD